MADGDHQKTWKTLVKTKKQKANANLPDPEAARATFSWEAARAQLEGLPDGGLNIAHHDLSDL